MEEPKGIRYGPGQLPLEYTPIRWDELVVGDEIGPIEFKISSETHRRHTEHLGMKHPLFTESSPWGDKVLYPWEMDAQSRVMSRKYGRLNQGIQTAFKWEFFKPAVVGQPLVGRTAIIDKCKKRGKDYYKNQTTTSVKGEIFFRSTCEFFTLVDYEGELRV
jgi:hypothetical protein